MRSLGLTREQMLKRRYEQLKTWRINNPEACKQKRRDDYLKHKENYQRLKRESNDRRMEIKNRLKMQPCKDCGKQFNPWIMEFDHRDPSQKKICASSHCSLEDFKIELEKCDVVCANCHRERTYRQRKIGAFNVS
jgi:hypothetical protein